MTCEFRLSGFADEIGPEPEVQIEGLRRNGVGHVEIRKVGNAGVLDLTESDARAFRDALEAAEIGVSAIGSPVGKVAADADPDMEFARFLVAVERARFFGTRNIRIFSFYPGQLSGSAWRDAAVRQLERMIRHASAEGILLLHENEKGIYGESPEHCLDLMTTLGGNAFQAIWDPSNFVQAGVGDMEAAWRMLSSHVAYFHIKDARRADGAVVPAGEGDGCVKQVLASAAATGFRGFLSLEPHLRGEAYGADGAARFRTAVEALRKLLAGIGVSPA